MSATGKAEELGERLATGLGETWAPALGSFPALKLVQVWALGSASESAFQSVLQWGTL